MKHINEYSEFKKSLNEGPGKGYYIEVAVRDARKALAILDDMYRKKFDINGSNVYYFKDEDMAYDAKMDLAARDIEITDTNIEESLDEDADPCWDDYKIGSPKTKISSKSGKRVNNCVPKDESEVNEAMNKSNTLAKDVLRDATDALTKTMGSRKLDKKYIKDYLKSIEQMARKSPSELVKDYGDFDINDWLEDVKYNLQNEGNLTEAMDINDPILMAIRARRTQIEKAKGAPKIKKISIAQYYKLMDKESDLISQVKDAARELNQLDSDMNVEAGQKGAEWTDTDANRYGGDLDKLQTKVETLNAKRQKVRDAIKNYRMS
jgi:hypothetical protein